METIRKTLGAVLPEPKTTPTSSTTNKELSPDGFLFYAGVPKRYIAATLADFWDDIEIPQYNDSGLFLAGGVGRGKTHLAAAIMRDCLPRLRKTVSGRPSATWVSVPDLLLEIRDSFNSPYGNVSERTVIERYASPHLLVLDDFGAEKSTEWAGEKIYTIISRRVNECRPTIVTSNLSLKEIHATDPRLASRLGGMTKFEFEGEDRRLKC